MYLSILIYIVQLIQFLIIGRVVMSWISRDTSNPFVRFFYQITEPILAPIRDLLNRLGLGGGMLDFSPIVAILFFNILLSIFVRL